MSVERLTHALADCRRVSRLVPVWQCMRAIEQMQLAHRQGHNALETHGVGPPSLRCKRATV